MNQKTFRLTLSRQPGQLAVNHRIEEARINSPRNVEAAKPQSDNVAQCLNHLDRARLLKRLARRAMANVGECPPEHTGAHLCLLEALIEIFEFNLRRDLKETPEAVVSATPLKPYSMADYLHCLLWTRKQHRAPAFVSQRDEDIAGIHRKLDAIGNLFARNQEVQDVLQRQREEMGLISDGGEI